MRVGKDSCVQTFMIVSKQNAPAKVESTTDTTSVGRLKPSTTGMRFDATTTTDPITKYGMRNRVSATDMNHSAPSTAAGIARIVHDWYSSTATPATLTATYVPKLPATLIASEASV